MDGIKKNVGIVAGIFVALTTIFSSVACGGTTLAHESNDSDAAPKPTIYNSLDSLVMAGYQGWFNTPDDGTGLRWKHYELKGKFEPGQCSIDLWPDMSEYEVKYKTDFVMPDGKPAYVFSSHDKSTVNLHFKWMKEYGLDGVFVQRFVTNLKESKKSRNSLDILMNCVSAAELYSRAICVMYDLSGMKSGDEKLVMEDWDMLMSKKITTRSGTYLWHKGKPVVAVWGIGFSDGRAYGLEECEHIIDYLKKKGCAVMLGVPTKWRTLDEDAVQSEKLLELIKKADIVHPWLVGRFNNDSFKNFHSRIRLDMLWCKSNGLDYIPTVFPGFSWYNLRSGNAPLNQIPRLGGDFFWNQISFHINSGARSLYVAMFDEIDEGTAIFKCSEEVPVGESLFVSYEDVPSDYYLKLAGTASEILHGKKTVNDKPLK